MKPSTAAPFALSALALLSACGGGGGGVSSTPPPPTSATPSPSPSPSPTPTPTNSSLLNLTASQSFTNNASTTSGTFYTDARVCRCSASQPALTISYDAGSHVYTVSVLGRSQSFRPSDLDASQSSATVQVFSRTSGSLTESLTITRPGTSGALTYQYVGGGYWQRATTSGDHVDTTFDAFAYGIETPNSATPRTGSAVYDIDVIGAYGWGIPVALAGSGIFQIDFGSGAVLASGTITQVSIETGASMGSGAFSGTGTLSSSSNLFNGSFRFEAIAGTLAGTMTGRLYGPNAEEIGAAFAVTASDGRAGAGTLTGRRGASGSDSSFATLSHTQFLANNATLLDTHYSGSSISSQSAASEPLLITYNANTHNYLVQAPNRSYLFDGASFPSDSFPISDGNGLQYVHSARLTHTTSTSRQVDELVFGFKTADASVPRTGDGYFPIVVTGSLNHASQVGQALDLVGSGLFTAHFGTGAISLEGGLTANYLPLSGRPPAVPGTFSGSGTISSSANSFSGAFTLDLLGIHTGNFVGGFYGPDAQEVGGTFYAVTADGQAAAGSFLGKNDPSIATSYLPLASYMQDTDFAALAAYLRYGVSPIYYIFDTELKTGDVAQLHWSPSSHSYTMTRTGDSIAFGPADLDAANTNASFTAYHRAEAGRTIDASIYNGATGPVALTYGSFAAVRITAPRDTPASTIYESYYLPFGTVTARAQMPTTGSASYSGALFGSGAVLNSTTAVSQYELSGTSLFNVDFFTSEMSGALHIIGANVDGSGNRDFGTITLTTQNVSNQFTLGVYSSGTDNILTSGSLVGYFFGPKADEIAGGFEIKRQPTVSGPDYEEQYFVGGVVAKKNP